MINACNQCGNALGECECGAEPMEVLLSKHATCCYTVEATQREAYGKACYLAFWGFLPLQKWEDMSETHRDRWRAAAVSTAIEVMRSPMVKT